MYMFIETNTSFGNNNSSVPAGRSSPLEGRWDSAKLHHQLKTAKSAVMFQCLTLKRFEDILGYSKKTLSQKVHLG